MEQAFQRHLSKWQWPKNTRVLVAVSGGVDSMVLLHLLENLPATLQLEIGVAHFNHRLREVSDQEASELRAYCHAKKIPYFEKSWKHPTQTNVEHQARQARYAFLFEIYREYGYDYLLTAHHADDQAETILMKLLKGSSLRNFEGIREMSCREGVKIVRPLLAFKKAELVAFAQANQVLFWEDETNHSLLYLRNRIRHQILPLLAQENKDYTEKINQFTQEISLANQALSEWLTPKLKKMMTLEKGCQQLDLVAFLKESQAVQHQLLQLFIQETLIERGGYLQQIQLKEIEKMLPKAGNHSYQLANGWWAQKNYGKFNFYQRSCIDVENTALVVEISEQGTYPFLGQARFILSQSEGPEKIEQNDGKTLEIPASKLPLTIRTQQAGDRFVLDSSGQTKKVSRFFIDQKIPSTQRSVIPLVVDNQGNVIWIVGFRKSYLSIADETDKIFYKLTYNG